MRKIIDYNLINPNDQYKYLCEYLIQLAANSDYKTLERLVQSPNIMISNHTEARLFIMAYRGNRGAVKLLLKHTKSIFLLNNIIKLKGITK